LYATVEAFKSLSEEEFKLLRSIEVGMAKFMYVPVEYLSSFTKWEEERVIKMLKKLHELGLVQRRKGAYIGFILTTRGYDCLALNALVKRGVIGSLSLKPLGVGKESDVYEGLTPSGLRIAVKFHRLGRISFRATRRYRIYVGDRRHISWLYQSRLAAEREYEALKILYDAKVEVPKPISHNRHVVVMDIIEGIPLFEKPRLKEPLNVLIRVLGNIKRGYECGVIHGDLSEYNIIIKPEIEELKIIDWPQWVPKGHPEAVNLLRRDIANVINFFRRKYRVKFSEERALELVLGGI